MSVAALIWRTYRAPRAVIAFWLARPQLEARSLAMLMGGCVLVFISVLPYALKVPGDAPVNARLGAALFAWLAVAPLVLFAISGLIQMLRLLFGSAVPGWQVRLALFWAFLASAPLWLLNGIGLAQDNPFVQKGLGGISLLGLVALVWACQRALPVSRKVAA